VGGCDKHNMVPASLGSGHTKSFVVVKWFMCQKAVHVDRKRNVVSRKECQHLPSWEKGQEFKKFFDRFLRRSRTAAAASYSPPGAKSTWLGWLVCLVL
jgi:hypothetical protein